MPSRVHYSDAGQLTAVYYTLTVSNSAMKSAVLASGRDDLLRKGNPRLTPAEVKAVYEDDKVGASRYTYYGKGTWKSWTKHASTGRWTGTYKIVNESPTFSEKARAALRRDCHWYNPTCWSWGDMIGGFWNDVLVPCFKGIESGFTGSFGGSAISKWLFYRALVDEEWIMDVTPQGLAYTAAQGCTFGILSHAQGSSVTRPHHGRPEGPPEGRRSVRSPQEGLSMSK